MVRWETKASFSLFVGILPSVIVFKVCDKKAMPNLKNYVTKPAKQIQYTYCPIF